MNKQLNTQESNFLTHFCTVPQFVLPPTNINTGYSGYFTFISPDNSGLPGFYKGWQDCCASIATHPSKTVYVYFPALWVGTDHLIKWLNFIDVHYGISTRYLGTFYAANDKFYYSTRNIESHLIALDPPPSTTVWFSNEKLLRLTFIRYLYFPTFFEHLILPLYHMVEELEMDPWDALIIAHLNRYRYDKEGVRFSARLSLTPPQLSLFWPKSKDELRILYNIYKTNNNIFAGINTPSIQTLVGIGYLSPTRLSIPECNAPIQNQNINALYKNNLFALFCPQHTHNYNIINNLLVSGDYKGALNHHIKYLKSLLPIIEILEINGHKPRLICDIIGEINTDLFYQHVINFLFYYE